VRFVADARKNDNGEKNTVTLSDTKEEQTMEDWKLWRIWFIIAGIGAILVAVLPLFGIPVD